MFLQTKFQVKIPNEVSILYSKDSSLLTLIGPLRTQTLDCQVQVHVLEKSKFIYVSDTYAIGTATPTSPKVLKSIQKTTLSRLKKILVEITQPLYKRLILKGVGYRVNASDIKPEQITLKLGYSHSVFLKVPKNIKCTPFMSTKMFLQGDCGYQRLTSIEAAIRKIKSPEPYKGKGILREGENVALKKSKKI